MFDVIWTDPDRELVGERRARKEAEREQRLRGKNRQNRSSSSTRSSLSTGEKPFGFLGSKSLKRVISSPKSSKPSTPPGLPATTPFDARSHRASSYLGVRTIIHESDLSSDTVQLPAATATTVSSALVPDVDAGEITPSSVSRDSVFSKWTEPSSVTCQSTCGTSIADSTAKSSVVQTLGPSSFITKSTEVTVSPRTPDTNIDRMVTEVTISSDGQRDEPPTPPLSPVDLSTSPPRADTPVSLIPGIKSPARSTSSHWQASFKPNNPDSWKPPDAWDCPPSFESRPRSIEEFDAQFRDIPSPESYRRLEEMQQELRRMANAPPQEIIARLKLVWGASPDASLYKRLETEQKHWMLSTLDHLDPVVETNPTNPPSVKTAIVNTQKVLALYETQATASYLAGLHYNKDVYHLSTSPLSPDTFPNIHPLRVPAASPSSFPVASRLFGEVHSLSLPAVCSSADIPRVLRNIHRSLAPGGTFHMTLIDPLPCPNTLGPHMRAWLEDNLLFNLERRFRCVSPSKLFPVWLADAHMRADGSTITAARFGAVPHKHDTEDVIWEESGEAANEEKTVKNELRTLVGRMLWMEVWGSFVEAENWWWEVPACVEECHGLGTYWEYSIIEAVKEDAAAT